MVYRFFVRHVDGQLQSCGHFVIPQVFKVHMAKTALQLLAVVAVLFAEAQLQSERCPRASPEEIWYGDYSPQLKFTVLEGKINSNRRILHSMTRCDILSIRNVILFPSHLWPAGGRQLIHFNSAHQRRSRVKLL